MTLRYYYLKLKFGSGAYQLVVFIFCEAGWISSIFGLVTGGLLIMGGCGTTEENDFEETYPVAKYESGTMHHHQTQDQTHFSSKPENNSMQKTQMSQYV